MSRPTAARLVRYFKENPLFLVKEVAIDLNLDESTVREWLYAFRREGLVQRTDRQKRETRRGLQPKYWEWIV